MGPFEEIWVFFFFLYKYNTLTYFSPPLYFTIYLSRDLFPYSTGAMAMFRDIIWTAWFFFSDRALQTTVKL